MSNDVTYEPPKVWTWEAESGGRFASINRPTAGATHDKDLPVGEHALQLYSLATPNGVKVTVLLEELLEAVKAVGLTETNQALERSGIGPDDVRVDGTAVIIPLSK